MTQNFKLDVDGDGIALVTWDMPDKSMNVIDVSVMEELETIVEKVTSDAAIKGAVITSGKDTFGGGADLTMLEKQRDDYETTFKAKGEEAANAMVFAMSRRLSQVFRKLETSGKPWVAALNGTAMGGSACLRSRSGCFPAPAVRSVSRA
jgi:3-hydroxyacyl-CoA dehydrogenase/enoyl-CoA hydratase/3-hydroxybutyryl-CoA epimerase